MDIGSKIKEIREKRGMTQDELAKELNISKSALWNYEKNKRAIPVDILIKCSNILKANFIAPALEEVLVVNNKTETNTNNIELDSEIEKRTNMLISLDNDIKHLKKLKETYENTIKDQEKIITLQEKLIDMNKKRDPDVLIKNTDFQKIFAKEVAKYVFDNNLVNITEDLSNNKINIEMKILDKDGTLHFEKTE